jgi:phospholipase/carboxylesterase
MHLKTGGDNTIQALEGNDMIESSLEYIEINPSAQPAYVVIWLHGLGADGHDFEALVPELRMPADLPVRYIFPHAPMRPITVNMGMVMRGWYDIVEPDVSRDVDFQGIEASAAHLTSLIQHEIEAGMPSERILLAGFSQGGVIVLHAGLRFKFPLAGILALSTYCPTLTSLGREQSTANQRIPIMMAHGRYDPLISVSLGEAARDRLLDLGYPVQWHEYPIQHELCLEEIQQVRSWMLEVMTPGLHK